MWTSAPSWYHYRAKSSSCGTVGYSSLTMEMCITPHSAMDNTIHSIWKSKSSFPTSCKQCCPQLHKTGSYTHCPQCRRQRNPTHLFIPTLKIKNFFKEKEPQHFCQGSGKSFLMGSTGCLLLRKLQRTCFINGWLKFISASQPQSHNYIISNFIEKSTLENEKTA